MASSAPPDTRTWPPTVGTERAMLTGLLDYHRETLARHLTELDRDRFSEFFGEPAEPIYRTEEAPEGDFDATDSVPVAEVFTRWRAETERIRQGLAAVPLDAEITEPRGRSYSLRWNYLHVIEEYARHNGHADLLREAIDGVTGE